MAAFEEVADTGSRWLNALKSLGEAQRGRLFLWSPVLLVFGIWAYFALTAEPGLVLVGLLGVTGLLVAVFARTRTGLVILALLASGFVLAKLRAEWVETPLLRATVHESLLEGRIAHVEGALSKRRTVLLDVSSATGMPASEVPRRIRLSVTGEQSTLLIGDRVTLAARLSPLPLPVMPGGFDYGRQLYFQAVGATGRSLGRLTVEEGAVPWSYQVSRLFQYLRHAIGSRILASLPDRWGAIADALITGERSSIPREVNSSLQASGLFHILSISGLHMTLVAGGVFWAVRAILALIPVLALRYPIRKWAAAAALLVGLLYMLLADSGAATERSYIMIAVVFFAMLVDRPAISLRNLAIAALIILVREPEQAVAASFQMSFMAVMGLAAFYEFWSRREQESRPIRRGIPAAVGLYLWRIAWMSVVTTLIAGTLSGIPASYHFGRMAPYGVLANGLALPVVGAVVMPAALISVLLMPLGLEAYPLYIMGEGLKVVILISDWVAGLPGAGAALPQAGVWPMLFLATGFAVLCLAGGTLRYAGILPLLLALPLIAGGKGPDVLIEGTGANVAVRDGERRWVPADPRKGRFAVERWLTANGEEETLAKAAKRPGWTCGNGSCSAVENDRKILFLNDENRQPASCPKADVVIANYPLRGLCKGHPLRIDRFDLWRRGSHALTFTGAGIVVTTAREEQGARPWFVDPRSRSRAEQPQGPSAP